MSEVTWPLAAAVLANLLIGLLIIFNLRGEA